MKNEILLSAGIDIGTTTTHLIISKIGISVEGGFGTVPKAKITEKKIIYKSPVYLTPLDCEGNIDGKAVAEIIAREYKKAGVTKSELKSGAVIVTGESSKKKNACTVLQDVSELSGDFVAAQAGAELESFLAGKGAGADEISKETGKITANIDIGGGTTNISVFYDGECVDESCLNIGGRAVRFENGKEIVSDTISPFYNKCRNSLPVLCERMADAVFSAITGEKVDPCLITDHPLKGKYIPEVITFSGGVGECLCGAGYDRDFNDIGIDLAKAIKERFASFKGEIKKIENPIRATVIGAGNFSMEISGSTIQYAEKIKLPIKNLECIRELEGITDKPCAICPKSEKSPSFEFVNSLAKDIVNACREMIKNNIPVVVITKYDFSKALGICLKKYLPCGYPFICADGIDCTRGDYVDIGLPVAEGKAVPVVVKTLVFGG